MRLRLPALCLVPLLLVACEEAPEPMFASQRGSRGGASASRERGEGVAAAQPPREQPRPAPPAQPVQTGDQRAPDRFTVRLDTTKGPILIDVHREWAPYGADRFYTLVREGYYTDVAFFRVIEGFMAQAGISGDPALNTRWRERRIPDDPVRQSNTRGMVSFAMAGPNTRTTQFFINFVDNRNLDGMGFAPFGRVRDMTAVDRLYSGYGEGAPRGRGPDQGRIQREGNAYLRAEFPELDYIRSATIVE
ncbi:MAG TPA: peptidylprolyl isomerase [Sandaracinaceae bacterium]